MSELLSEVSDFSGSSFPKMAKKAFGLMPINQGEFNYNVNFEQDKEPENLGPMITNIPFSLEQPREQLTNPQ